MPATLPPSIASKSELQARLAAIEAEERRIEGIGNTRTRLQNAVATGERNLAKMREFIEKLKADAAERWQAMDRRIATHAEILDTSNSVGGHLAPNLHAVIDQEFAHAKWQSFRLSRADELWIKPCESALESAREELAAFTKSNPEPKSNP